MNLDPLNTNGASHVDEELRDSMQKFPQPSAQASTSPHGLANSVTASALPFRSDPIHIHRKGTLSTGSTPQQTILKALASRPPKNGQLAPISVSSTRSTSRVQSSTDLEHYSQRPNTANSHSDLGSHPKTPFTARLKYPCFFHQRFDDAVNTDRVLEEIAMEDDGYSHDRLMQTATSVREISKQLQRRPIKRAVRTVMIVTKARDNSLVYLTRELTEWLFQTPRYNSDLGVTVYVDAKLKTSKRFDVPSLLAKNPRYEKMLKYWTPDLCWSSPEIFDLVLTLGGDGTVLYTSWLFQRIVPPILSFSLGSLGFLTNFEFSSYKTHLNRIMGEHGMRVNLRMRFTCTVFHAPSTSSRSLASTASSTSTEMVEGEQFEVLNELVIDRGPSPYVSNLELYGDNELLTVVQADGCIISTPTGSTAYSLSAGGPLTHPSIPGILLTPICPHTLSFRPMVLSDTLLLKICVPRSSRSTAYASFDGKGRVELRRGDYVQVEAGRYPFPTVVGEHGTGGEWFESVRRALRWNNRGALQKGFNGAGDRTGTSSVDEFDDADAALRNGGRDGEEGLLDGEDGEEEEWDIDADPIDVGSSSAHTDSGIGVSEGGSGWNSPLRKTSLRSGEVYP